MNSELHFGVICTLAATLLAAVTSTASAQDVAARATPAEGHDIIRGDLAVEVVNRTFELTGPSEVLFDAPYYAGLRVHVQLFPVALFDATSPAAGLGVALETSKHTLNTVAAVDLDGETYDFTVPTRHDITHLALLFEWQPIERLTITPALAWHTVELALGYNPLYRNSFYKGVELSGAVDYGVGPQGLSLGAGVRVRPGVNLGSTVEPYGSTSSSFAFGIDAGLRYASRIGIYATGGLRYERYSTTYRPDRNEDRDDSKSTDSFQSFIFALGYAY